MRRIGFGRYNCLEAMMAINVCPKCGNRMRVRRSRRLDAVRVRSYKCPGCGWELRTVERVVAVGPGKPNEAVEPVEKPGEKTGE